VTKGLGPFLEVARIQSEINRLFDNLLHLDAPGQEAGAWIPNADVLETEDDVVVKVELSGVAAGDFEVAVHGGNVIVRGEKRRSEDGTGGRYHVAERAFGRFRRVIPLGVPVNTHRAEAVLADGCLRIRFPKVPNRRGEEVRVEVKAS
jgi:Molecular chaperone (small heat shock protein)